MFGRDNTASGRGPGRGRPVRRWIRPRRLIGIAVATYLGVVILVGVFQRRLIYFPARAYAGTPRDVGLDYESVSFEAEDGVALTGWYVPRAGARHTVLFFHGNAGNISHRLPTVQALHRLGFEVFLFDYRGYGGSGGSPSERGLYVDARGALSYLLQTRGVGMGRIVYCGRSLGGAVAIELAVAHPPAALIVESTFTGLVEVAQRHYPLLPVRWMLRERFASIERIGKIACPKLVLHGRDDALIPIALGRRLFEAANEPKRFLETPGGHNEAGFTYSHEFEQALKEFVTGAVGDGGGGG